MGRFRADDGFVRIRDGLQAEDVCAGASENKIDGDVFAEMFLKDLDGAFSKRIVAIGDDMPLVRRPERLNGSSYVRAPRAVIRRPVA